MLSIAKKHDINGSLPEVLKYTRIKNRHSKECMRLESIGLLLGCIASIYSFEPGQLRNYLLLGLSN